MQRVVGGRLRGRRLLALPRGVTGVRPTGARVREAIFGRLQREVVGARVLDLFAGTGAMAIEALSRGAAFATCVEVQPRLAQHLQRQLIALAIGGDADVRAQDVMTLLRAPAPDEPYDIVFVDPPYRVSGATVDVLGPLLAAGAWLRDGAVIVHEYARAEPPGRWPAPFELERRRHYGQTGVDFLRWHDPRRSALAGGDGAVEVGYKEPVSTQGTDALTTNARAAAIQPSATLAMTGRAKELSAAGKQVLAFSAGEPDFRPPEPVVRAVAEYVREQPVKYTGVAGMPELRDAAAADLSRFHGRTFTRDEILVSCGAKHSLANLMLVTLSPGDEVVIPAPFWVSYPDMVTLGGGTSVIVETDAEHGLRLQPVQLERVLNERTKFVLLNSPSNPTGVGYTGAQLRALGEVVAAKAPQAWIVCDDIYRHLVYDDFVQESAFRALEGVTDRIVIADGVSKSHAMTGFRIGFLAAPRDVIDAAARVQGQMTSGATTTSQIGALAALTDPACEPAMAEMRAAFARRRALMLEGLAKIPHTHTPRPDGAFYLFPNVAPYVGPGTRFADDLALATWLLDEHLVATVPGTPFGAPGNLRISYATDDDSLREGLARLQRAFASLPARA